MMQSNLMALLYSYLYVGGVVAVGEIGRRLGLPRAIARKLIHFGVGFWIFVVLALFDSPWMAAIPPITAAAGNWYIHRKRLLKAVEASPEDLGTVWYPISFALLILICWDRPPAMVGGVMAMTIGDALAATVGQRWGRRRYLTLGGEGKSLEGSWAMFAGTAVVIWLVLQYSTPAPDWLTQSQSGGWGLAVLAGVLATCAEGLGVKGRDNLWVPLSVGALLYWAYGPLVSLALVSSLGLGAALALLIGSAAWLKGSLTPSGVLGAIGTGTLIFGLSGWPGGLALSGFFLSSSLLSRLSGIRKAGIADEYAKSGQRDLGQAIANGGIATGAAVLLGITGDPSYLGALLGALAAANADTWATEIGVFSRSIPRLIITLRPALPGTSGAVSALGTVAAAGGAALVGLMGALGEPGLLSALPWVVVAGLGGSLLDSLLGATVQGMYRCPACDRETERQLHRCGSLTVPLRGLSWMNNDRVNLLATLGGAVIGFLTI